MQARGTPVCVGEDPAGPRASGYDITTVERVVDRALLLKHSVFSVLQCLIRDERRGQPTFQVTYVVRAIVAELNLAWKGGAVQCRPIAAVRVDAVRNSQQACEWDKLQGSWMKC